MLVIPEFKPDALTLRERAQRAKDDFRMGLGEPFAAGWHAYDFVLSVLPQEVHPV